MDKSIFEGVDLPFQLYVEVLPSALHELLCVSGNFAPRPSNVQKAQLFEPFAACDFQILLQPKNKQHKQYALLYGTVSFTWNCCLQLVHLASSNPLAIP